MRYLLILILIGFQAGSVFGQEKKYFDKVKFSVYQGYRNIIATQHLNEKHIDFLNYMYTQESAADYPYFELDGKIRHHDKYELELRLALYNNLVPYCFNASYKFYLTHELSIEAGINGNRYYLTEFNSYYNKVYGNDITSRSIQRQWNISLMGVFLGPNYQFNYQSVEVNMSINAGMSSFYPFYQENIIKFAQSNYKLVHKYQTMFHFQPFVMPEIELSMDFMQYRHAIIGGRIKYALMYTKSAIKYELSSYEWTYDEPVKETILLSNHSFVQSDIDLGIFFRW